MKYRLTTLTPTLVGDGNFLSPIDYMVWRDQINVLNQTRIFKLLAKGPRLEPYLAQLRKATKLDFASWGGFAQNYADRRIAFEDASCTPAWNSAPAESLSIPTFASADAGPFLPGAAIKGALRTAFIFSRLKSGSVRDLGEKLAGDRLPRRPAESLESNAAGSGGSDRLRAVSIADSAPGTYDRFRVYMMRSSTLIGKGPQQYALGWKPTPAFAEMASPGTAFEGDWRENAFLNREEVRQMLRWNQPVTHKTLFDAANQYAAKQLEIHARYAEWTGLETLGASVANLRQKLETARNSGSCLLSIGWGAGFISKTAAIGADEADQRKILGLLPYFNRAIQSGLPFPKTRRIVFLGNKPATLAGWVEIKVQ